MAQAAFKKGRTCCKATERDGTPGGGVGTQIMI